MNRKILYTGTGRKHQILGMEISNFLPNKYASSIGHFVFLDYNPPRQYPARAPQAPDGGFAHPHRGIATFTYVTQGEFEHFDSLGNHEVVGAGGAQWMKAGNGIVHDENFSQSFQQRGGVGSGLQFWINLPSAVKSEAPEYVAIQADNFPKIVLPDNAGFLKVLIGEFDGQASVVKTYAHIMLYHLQINPGQTFVMETESRDEYAALTLSGDLIINGTAINENIMMVFGHAGSSIHVVNPTTRSADIMLFGGEPYTESIIAKGPFVMNNNEEIEQAYTDYKAGKYGTIQY